MDIHHSPMETANSLVQWNPSILFQPLYSNSFTPTLSLMYTHYTTSHIELYIAVLIYFGVKKFS